MVFAQTNITATVGITSESALHVLFHVTFIIIVFIGPAMELDYYLFVLFLL